MCKYVMTFKCVTHPHVDVTTETFLRKATGQLNSIYKGEEWKMRGCWLAVGMSLEVQHVFKRRKRLREKGSEAIRDGKS